MSDDFSPEAPDLDAADGGIDEPQLEYDDETALELAGDEELGSGAPDSAPASELLNDDDFERVLGNAHQIISPQEVVDSEFADIAKSGVIQVVGDDVGGRRVVMLTASKLPANSVDNAHDRLLRYMRATLDTFVRNEYAIVYLHHGLTRENRPSFGWMRKAYQELDRDYKKNLKALYIVHPTGWIRVAWTFLRPFISAKFAKKVVYVNLLSELANYIDITGLQIPQVIKSHDQELQKARNAKQGASRAQNDNKLDAAAYANWNPSPRQAGAATLQQIKMLNGGRMIPPIVEDTVAYLRRHGLTVEGIFRKSAAVSEVRAVQASYSRGERVDFTVYGDAVHLVAGSLKMFLRELGEPLCTFELFDEIIRLGMMCDSAAQHGSNTNSAQMLAARELVCEKLPDENYELLQFLCIFLREVADSADLNQMHAMNLAIVFGPNLVWSRTQAQSLTLVRPINAFVQLLITDANEIFVKGNSY